LQENKEKGNVKKHFFFPIILIAVYLGYYALFWVLWSKEDGKLRLPTGGLEVVPFSRRKVLMTYSGLIQNPEDFRKTPKENFTH